MGKAKIDVGGDFTNEGKTKIYDTDLSVRGGLIQKGEFIVNDPHKFLEAVKTVAGATSDIASFGKKVLSLLKGSE